MKPHGKGFTLIELLIVVAIIGILAAIAVPNFLNARIRAQIAKVQEDIRSYGIAIESYRVDHNAVPGDYNTMPGKFTSTMIDAVFILTTPIAYISGFSPDPFNPGTDLTGISWLPDSYHYRYAEYITKKGCGDTWWSPFLRNEYNKYIDRTSYNAIAWSVGPSKKRYFPGTGFDRGCWQWDYDASNGLQSFGSIRRFEY